MIGHPADVLGADDDEMLADAEGYLELKVRADELRQVADATLGEQSRHADRLSSIQADD